MTTVKSIYETPDVESIRVEISAPITVSGDIKDLNPVDPWEVHEVIG